VVNKINFNNKKVIIADVDDTICESCQQISPEMAKQISRMIKNGYKFAFISGTKNSDLMKMISSIIKEEHHLLGTTGTNYILIKDGNPEVKYNLSFTIEEKKEIFNALEELIVEFNINSMTTKEDQLQDRDSQITLSAIGRNAPSIMKRNHDPDGIKRATWVKYLRNFLSKGKYDIKVAGTTSIDITRKGLDKEWGIRKFSKFNNINFDEILFFGDKIYPGGNDYPATRIVDCIAVKSPQDTLNKLKNLESGNLKDFINNNT